MTKYYHKYDQNEISQVFATRWESAIFILNLAENYPVI